MLVRCSGRVLVAAGVVLRTVAGMGADRRSEGGSPASPLGPGSVLSVAAEGDRAEQFRACWDAAYGPVRSFVLRRVPSELVDDAVAEVFVVAWRRFDALPVDAQQQLWWLFGVARRVVGNVNRASRRRGALLAKVMESRPLRAVPPADALIEALDVPVRLALESLSAADREVLVMSAWDELSADAIAVVLGVSPAAAAKRLQRARLRFAAVYAEVVGRFGGGVAPAAVSGVGGGSPARSDGRSSSGLSCSPPVVDICGVDGAAGAVASGLPGGRS